MTSRERRFPEFIGPDGEPTHLPISYATPHPTFAAGENVGWLNFDPGGPGWEFWDGATWTALGSGGGGGGDMFKATYDTDNDTIVDRAEQLEGPTLGANVSTAAQVAADRSAGTAHFASTSNPHSVTAAQVGAPPTSRAINTTAPLSGGGDLSADRTLSIQSSAASRLFGRGSAAGAGVGQEIVLGTNLSMAGTTLNASGGGGSTPTGTGFRHVTAGVEDAAAKLVDTADVNNGQVTNAKLADMAQATAKGRAAGAGTGPPTDLTPAEIQTIINATATPATANAVVKAKGTGFLDNDWIQNGTFDVSAKSNGGLGFVGPALLTLNVTGNVVWVKSTVPGITPMVKAAGTNVVWVPFVGTSFPVTSPHDGQRFYRTDHNMGYQYSSAAGGWLSDSVFTMHYCGEASIAATNFTAWGYPGGGAGVATTSLFTTTRGELFGFDVKVVGMTFLAGGSSTCTLAVTSGGTAVTGAAVSVTAGFTVIDETLLSNTIASSVIGVKVTAGTAVGSAAAPFSGTVRFRRFAT